MAGNWYGSWAPKMRHVVDLLWKTKTLREISWEDHIISFFYYPYTFILISISLTLLVGF